MRRPIATVVLLAGCGGDPQPPASEQAAVATPEPTVVAPAVAPVAGPPAVEWLRDPTAFVGRHVLVPAGAALAVAANDGAIALRLREPGQNDPVAFAFAVTGTRDGWLQLVAAAPEHRCDEGLAGLDWLSPTWYVRPDALAPVLARETTARFADGTSLVLRAGTAIERTGDDGIVDLGGMRLHASIAARDVGNAYTPALPQRPARVPATLPSDTRLHYGEHVSDPPYRWWATDPGNLVALSRSEAEGHALVEVAHGCATLRAIPGEIRPDPRLAESARRTAIASALGGTDPHSDIAVGTAATWTDGTSAGTVRRAQQFAGAGKRRKALRCFVIGDGDARFEPIEVCFAAKGVTYVDPLAPLLAELAAYEDTAVLGVLGGSPESVADALAAAARADEPGLAGGMAATGARTLGTSPSGTLRTPRVRLARWSRIGALDETAVERMLTRLTGSIARCADTDLDVGTLSVEFEIDEDGRPGEISVSGIDALASCVRDGVAERRFAAAEDTTQVEATYELEL